MMTTAPNAIAWKVAAALAGDADWARWARGETVTQRVCGTCRRPMESSGSCTNSDGKHTKPCGGVSCRTAPVPVPAPWDADAYRADCWRRNVEPGPLPSLSWTGEDGFGWRVIRTGVVFYAWADHIATWDPDDDVLAFVSAYPRELVARIVTLATAAKRALR